MSQDLKFKSDYIDGIRMHGLPNAGHGEYHYDVLEKSKATPAIVQNLSVPLSIYEAAVQKETQASFKDMTESITKKINEELVPARNGVETGFKAFLRAQEESDDADVAAAAEMLTELAHLHHMHTDLKLNSQTDAIRDFIADVEANHMEALTLVGATTLFNKLKAANDAVCEAVYERTEINSKRVTNEMLNARVATDNAYKGLIHCVIAIIYMQSLEPYNDFVLFVNQLIKDYKRMYPNSNTGSSSGSGSLDGDGGNDGDGPDDEENNQENPEPENPENPNPENPNPENPNPGTGGSTGGGSTLQPDPDDDDEIPEGDDPWRK